ncbi:MAG: flagellar biosynthetic protein FliO [Fimbriimonadaceae bacterium]|jgi:flagellar biogenesis protein FliO|nr:flagellar biosynthetic protein FliO [Fimbriimonadaceae bacterium]
MKKVVSLLILGWPLVGAAQEDLGTKKDLAVVAAQTQSTTPLVGGVELLQMVLALVVVVALLKFGLPQLIAKFGKKISTEAGSSIRIEETAAFGGGSLQVVSARGKTILLSVTQNGVHFLTDLTEPTHAKRIEEQAFFELLDDAKTRQSASPDVPFAAVELPQGTDAKSELTRSLNLDQAKLLLAEARRKTLSQHEATESTPTKPEESLGSDGAEERLRRLLRKSS